ncbi:MAG: phospholipid scramblase-related protein [Fibrobacteria bacterium]
MLDRKAFFIREHVGLLKLSETYDILDPESRAQLGVAKEKPGLFFHLLRLLVNKRLLPTKLFIYQGADPEDESRLLFSLHRGFALFVSKVEIHGPHGRMVGYLKSKLFSIGGGFNVFDAAGIQYAQVKGNWKGWTFQILDIGGKEIGTISKKWAGLGKELFTSADNYMIALHAEAAPGKAVLLLAAGLALDTVYKET